MTPERTEMPARGSSLIALLAGIWLFVSPWVYGAYTNPNAWNSWIIGAAIFVLGAIGMSRHATGASWLNAILGIWTFVSPWVYGYTTNTGRFINSLCVGVIVFIVATVGARTHTMPHGTQPAH